MRKITTTTLCIVAAVLMSFSASAQKMYKWVDDQGQVHYSDRPTKGAKELPVPHPPTARSTEVGATGDSELCAQKRAQLEQYQSAASIVEADALGNKREYSDVQRQQLIERTREAMSAACQP